MRDNLQNILSSNLRMLLKNIDDVKLNEIRIRIGKPIIVSMNQQEFYVNKNGRLCNDLTDLYLVKENDIKETIEYITNYSLYAYNDEIRKGFITVSGGHRIGICGKVIYDNNEIKTIRNINSINIRVSNQVLGCAGAVVKNIFRNGGFENTLIISPPGLGKTTLLRDMIRIISNGTKEFEGKTIGVVDERSEIASCYNGKPQNDVGIRTDVLDCCLKKDGMIMLIRSMKPQIIAVDEIGSIEDARMIEYCSLCGCKIIATVHGLTFDEVSYKDGIKKLMDENTFKNYIFCEYEKGRGWKKSIYNNKKELEDVVYD